jgi:phosphoglycolate phosphatase
MEGIKMRIPLFDIDNTLLEGGNRAHMGAYDFAIRTVYKRKASVSEISIDGMIDTQIIVEVLTRHGMSAQAVKRRMPEAIQAMNEHFVAHADEGKSRVMPGVLELLKALRKRACPMGLLSGNVEDIGWEKLRLGGINEYFQFGAFGSLAYRRVDLIPVAMRNTSVEDAKTL